MEDSSLLLMVSWKTLLRDNFINLFWRRHGNFHWLLNKRGRLFSSSSSHVPSKTLKLCRCGRLELLGSDYSLCSCLFYLSLLIKHSMVNCNEKLHLIDCQAHTQWYKYILRPPISRHSQFLKTFQINFDLSGMIGLYVKGLGPLKISILGQSKRPGINRKMEESNFDTRPCSDWLFGTLCKTL